MSSEEKVDNEVDDAKTLLNRATGVFGEATAAIADVGASAATKTVEGLGAAVDAATYAGTNISDAAVAIAVKQLITTMHYACDKIRESDEDLPAESKLIVTAHASVVSLSLEVPVAQIRDEPDSAAATESSARRDLPNART